MEMIYFLLIENNTIFRLNQIYMMCVDLPSKKKEKKKNQTKKAENYRSQHITLNLGEREKKKKKILIKETPMTIIHGLNRQNIFIYLHFSYIKLSFD